MSKKMRLTETELTTLIQRLVKENEGMDMEGAFIDPETQVWTSEEKDKVMEQLESMQSMMGYLYEKMIQDMNNLD